MTRLQAELHRLYLPPAGEPGVRALLLEVAGPASWEALAPAWQGVQADLELPAPAIAVSGSRGHQLWFSLRDPVPAARATAFLGALRQRYLAGIKPDRVIAGPVQAAQLPPLEAAPGHWAAFLAPDLAALFEDEPWLDLPPSDEAQANLLAQLESIKPEAFERALERLQPAPAANAAATQLDPRSFLLQVMNDSSIDLPLRIEAAKALLAGELRA